jgi:hypothetical protein
MDNNNVVAIRKVPTVRATAMEISGYSLDVGGGHYRVRRAVERGTQVGFVTIHDATGRPVLVFSASFPAAHIGQLIVAWRTGNRQGLERGPREGRTESAT